MESDTMPIPLSELLIDADTSLTHRLGDRYQRGTYFRLKAHLVKFAVERGFIQPMVIARNQTEQSQVLHDLDATPNAEAMRGELARYVESLANEEPRAVREGAVIPGLRLED
jgi:hypothetical protein